MLRGGKWCRFWAISMTVMSINKYPYLHDRRANKDHYPHNRTISVA